MCSMISLTSLLPTMSGNVAENPQVGRGPPETGHLPRPPPHPTQQDYGFKINLSSQAGHLGKVALMGGA